MYNHMNADIPECFKVVEDLQQGHPLTIQNPYDSSCSTELH